VTPGDNPYWRRNLAVVVLGSVTTLIAMTIMLPFLPLYVEQLGVHSHAAIAQWSGIAYGATFFAAAFAAPVWGRLADRYGRKIMLVRASLGMAVCMSLVGLAQNVWQLSGIRLMAGLAGGYASGSTILVATGTPRARSGWALGVLSSGVMAGNLIGPLVGGVLPPIIGIRETFFLAGGTIFLTFIATTLLVREERGPVKARAKQAGEGWSAIPDKRPVLVMLSVGLLLMLANMSVEPIITLYVATLVSPARVTLVSGLAMSAGALGSIVSASWLGRLGDRIGPWTVITGGMLASALLLLPQAFVWEGWQLVALRFLMGLALGGLLPSVTSAIRHSVPEHVTGRVLGLATSSQFAGQVAGPLLGGFVGGHIGMRAVFLGTALVMAGGAGLAWSNRRR
jgi:MFS family permease